MQVKKFEAKTMKEALEMIKRQLGPEAIILSAKDNTQGFGLVGQRSVEVTAAIPEGSLRRKQIAETKMPEAIRQKFSQAPARRQREYLEKSDFRAAPVVPPPPPKQVITKNTRYIEIQDEDQSVQISGVTATNPTTLAKQRVKSAAQQAWQAMNEAAVSAKPAAAAPTPIVKDEIKNGEIKALKDEIGELKKIIETFHKVPQSFMAMHPGAEFGLSYELSHTFQKLVQAGVGRAIAVDILEKAQKELPREQLAKPAFIDAWVAKYFLDNTKICDNRHAGKIHCFVGPSGQGKTTTLVKIAGEMVITQKKKIAILTTNVMKVGAAEQLRIYAQILNVPFGIIYNENNLAEALDKVAGVDYVLIDYPGLNLKTTEELDWLKQMLPPPMDEPTVHYVQSVLANEESSLELAGRYKDLHLHDVIFTGLDEAVQHGLIYNFQDRTKLPLHSFGIGRNIPEDLEPATKERVVDLIFKLSKFRKD